MYFPRETERETERCIPDLVSEVSVHDAVGRLVRVTEFAILFTSLPTCSYLPAESPGIDRNVAPHR